MTSWHSVEASQVAPAAIVIMGSAIAALIAILVTGRLRAEQFGAALGMLLLGSAATLAWVDAGHHVRYQHLRWPTELAEHHVGSLVTLALQAVFLVLNRGVLGRVLRSAEHGWLRGLVLGSILLSPLLAVPSRDPWAYAGEAGMWAVLTGLQALTVATLVPGVPSGWAAAISRVLTSRRTVPIAAAASGALVAVLNVTVYGQQPHLQDELAYWYQATLLAAGELSTAVPVGPQGPDAAGFLFFLLDFDAARGHVFPPVPIGYALVLAPALAIGMPWLANAVLAGLNVALMFMVGRELTNRRAATLASLLLAASPWSIFLGMSFMNHTVQMTCWLSAAWLLLRASRVGDAGWRPVPVRRPRVVQALLGLLSGLAVAGLALCRPLDAAIAGLLLGVRAIGVGGRRLRIPALVSFGVGAAVAGPLTLAINHAMTGVAWPMPVERYMNAAFAPNTNALGFGPDRGPYDQWEIDPFPGHGPLDAAVNIVINTAQLGVELHGWSIGSLALAGLALLQLVRLGGRLRGVWHALAVPAMVIGVYSLYWFGSGPDFGPRYWFMILPSMLLLTSLAVVSPRAKPGRAAEIGDGGSRLLTTVALSAVALVTFVPWRALDRYRHYLNVHPSAPEVARDPRLAGSLVIVRGLEHEDFPALAAFNPADLTGAGPIFVREVHHDEAQRAADGAFTARVRALYPDRPHWLVAGPSVTGGGYEVIAGPLRPDEPLPAEPLPNEPPAATGAGVVDSD